MSFFEITEREFKNFQSFIYEEAGITVSAAKKQLIINRLSKRLRHYNLNKFSDYFTLVHARGHESEKQMLIDLLTTNETYFFREHKHFDFIRDDILTSFRGQKFKCWSAACSNGAEPYTLSMLIDHHLGSGRWDIFATDISSRIIESAKQAVYDISSTEKIPREYLVKYCLKGVRSQQGSMMIDPSLSNKVRFKRLNLNAELSINEKFDLIMLRNIMIYFDQDTKKKLIKNLVNHLYPGGYLIIGHSESLNGVDDTLQVVKPSIYRLVS